MIYIFGFEDKERTFHFPRKGIHDNEYCDLFVKYFKTLGKTDLPVIKREKCKWQLTYHDGHDKSKFLNKLGYNIKDPDHLLRDIENGTDFITLKFSRITEYGINCKAMTKINGYIVTSVWEIKNDMVIRFVTLIPGGEREWKRN